MRPSDNEFVGYIIASTNAALFFKDHYWEEAFWVPKSQCRVAVADVKISEVKLQISSWICGKNNWKEFTYMPNTGAG